jgi:hypothetical protein
MITPPDSAPSAPAQMPASGWDIQAPYSSAPPSAILTGGDADPGGRDPAAGSVAGAAAAVQARLAELASDTYGQGSRIGDLLDLPDVVSDHSLGTGGDGTGSTPFEEGS